MKFLFVCLLLALSATACKPGPQVSPPVAAASPTPAPTSELGPMPVPVSPVPLELEPLALSLGQERHLRLKALAWSPDRSRFVYVLDDEIRGTDASLLQSLHLREQASQRERLLELPEGRVSRLWWLDAQTLVLLHQEPRTAELTPDTPIAYRLYRLQTDSGERVELRRFAFDGKSPEIYSLRPQHGSLLYLASAAGKLNLHVLTGPAENTYATALSVLRYDAVDAHRLYLPDSQSLILLAARRTAGSGRDTPRLFDLYRLSRGSGELTQLAGELKEGDFSLSPEGRYLLQQGQVQDLLTGRRKLIETSAALSWWSGRLLALEGEGWFPERASWYDALSGVRLATRQIDHGPAKYGDVSKLEGPLLSEQDQGALVWHENRAWFTPLAENRPEPAMAFQLDAGASVEVIGEGPYLLQSQPGGPLRSGAKEKMRLRVYGLSGGAIGQGFYPLLDIRAGLP